VHYAPTISEFAVLLLTDLLLCGVGVLVFRIWKRRDTVPPVPVVLVLTVCALTIYLGVTRYLWLKADPMADRPVAERVANAPTGDSIGSQTDPAWVSLHGLSANSEETLEATAESKPSRVLVVLAYCLLFWTVPVAYYSNVLVNSIAVRRALASSWTEIEIPDLSAFDNMEGFHEARELALAGSVSHVMDDDHSFSRKRVKGCLAAGRLLELEGQYDRAAELFREIAGQSREDLPTWLEATYNLARILEKRLDRVSEAVSLYNQLVMRAPDSDYGQMAFKAMRMVNPAGDPLLDTLDSNFDWSQQSAAVTTTADFDDAPDTEGSPGKP
jgi:hypothetical protein